MLEQVKSMINSIEELTNEYIIVGEVAFDLFESDNNAMYSGIDVLVNEENIKYLKEDLTPDFNIVNEYAGYKYKNMPYIVIDGVKVIEPKLLLDTFFNSDQARMFEEQIAHLAFLIYYDDMTEEERQAYYRHSRI